MLAYSTISQLGFMFMAAGMRAYAAAMFFLVAHAFYKALMFLGAGSVMHGMHEETDLQRMGGLVRRMPDHGARRSCSGRWRSPASPAGGVLRQGRRPRGREPTRAGCGLYVLGTLGALLSALYIGRLVFLTFFGTPAERGGRARARVAAAS